MFKWMIHDDADAGILRMGLPGHRAFAMAATHGADDDDVAGQSHHESNHMRDDNGHEVRVTLPR